jgi:hypothetical protein
MFGGGDDDDDDDVPSFFSAPSRRQPQRVVIKEEEDDEMPSFFATPAKTTTQRRVVAAPPAPATARRAPVPAPFFPASLQFENDEITPATIARLSTFDKGGKSRASVEQRLSVLDSRVRRSREKVISAIPSTTVDDSLLIDAIGSTARDYERHAHYKGSTRVGPSSSAKRPIVEEEEEEEQQDDEDLDTGGPMEIDDGDIYMDDGDDDGDDDDGDESSAICSKTMLVPAPVMHAIPETGNVRTVTTFTELIGPSPAIKQFESNMRHVKGPEQHVFVEVRPQEALYAHVSTTLDAPMLNQQLMRYAVKNGLSVPKLPQVSKAMVQDGLHAPDFGIGERPCVYGTKCESFKMSYELKRADAEKYAGTEPFACKEFYFGVRGEKVREAIARGLPLNEVLNPDPVMCVMCHMAVVTRFYKRFDLGLELDPPHILHSFEMIPNVEGQYPRDVMLMGDDTFKGIIGPFVRFCPDNYEWYPIRNTVTEEMDPITGLTHRMSRASIQCWTEMPVLDFPEGVV